MWSRIVLCFLVSYAYANNHPAWNPNTEYVYKMHVSTLSSLHEISHDRTGIIMKGDLHIQARTDNKLNGKISNAEYASVHAIIPIVRDFIYHQSSELSFKPLPISNKVFQIVIENDLITDVIVSADVTEWEANIIKSFVSQFQLDTNAASLIEYEPHTLPNEGLSTGHFKTMEETITGVYETMYDINPLPKYILSSEPWLVPVPEIATGEIFEIVKNKNFTNGAARPVYHYGFNGDVWEPSANQVGNFFTRQTINRIIVSGNLNHYTIQNIYTANSVVMSPGLNDIEKGSVESIINFNLTSTKQNNANQEVTDPVSLGGLMYRYNNPYDQNNKASSGKPFQFEEYKKSSSYSNAYNSEDNAQYKYSSHFYNRDEYTRHQSWHQPQQNLSDAPNFPLLPLYTGYKGKSIKTQFNVVEESVKLVKTVALDLKNPEMIPKQNTNGKYVYLISLARTMNSDEINEVFKRLNTHSIDTAVARDIYRDVIAEAGTGPSLLAIQDLIVTKQIEGAVAANVIETAAHAARQPNIIFMRLFFELVKAPEVQSQHFLNQSAALAFTELVRHVLVDGAESHSHYPIHVYGTFRPIPAEVFLTKEVIPWFTKHLHQAIDNADTPKIHLFIKALGNIAHRNILLAFEEYLEGRKQSSQFQRFMMVVALEHYANTHPNAAAPILYKIYKNPGEFTPLRIAAASHFFRTYPSAEDLQRMAIYTNVDVDDQVNAFIKSSIEYLSELEGDDVAEVRSAAQSARPLLTTKEFGYHYSYNYMRSYVEESIPLYYKNYVETYGSKDSFSPYGIRYGFYTYMGALWHNVINGHSMVSSVDEFINFFQEHNQQYKQMQENKVKDNIGKNNKWSSENVASYLDIQTKIREQIEGNFFVQMGSLQKNFGFDNRTLEYLFQVFDKFEQTIEGPQHYRWTKAFVDNELAISFPTETGYPFLFTHDHPTVFNVQGQFSAKAKPKIFSNQMWNAPNSIASEFDVHALVSAQIQSQFGFVTPFDSERYTAGYDKHFQVELPFHVKVSFDFVAKNMQSEVKPLQENVPTMYLHYSSRPYVAKNNVLQPDSAYSYRNRKFIIRHTQTKIDREVGEPIGLALQFNVHSDHRINWSWFFNKFQSKEILSSLINTWGAEHVTFTTVSLYNIPNKGTTTKLSKIYKYNHLYQIIPKAGAPKSPRSNETEHIQLSEISKIPIESANRYQQYFAITGSGISYAKLRNFEASYNFEGQYTIKYVVTFSRSDSSIDKHSRIIFHFQKQDPRPQYKDPYQIVANIESFIPDLETFDMDYALNYDSASNSKTYIAFGENLESKINIFTEWHKTQERKEFLRKTGMYTECQRQMKEGNYQQPACANMTFRAGNVLDDIDINIEHNNLPEQFINISSKIYNYVRVRTYPYFDENVVHKSEVPPNKAEFNFNYHSPDDTATVRFTNDKIHTSINRINSDLGDYYNFVKHMFIPHIHMFGKSRWGLNPYKYEIYRPMCAVDGSVVNTFNNKTYKIPQLGKAWVVAFQYVPQSASYSSQQSSSEYPAAGQLKSEIYNYVVLVRKSEQGVNYKDVKISVLVPNDHGAFLDITVDLAPTSGEIKANVSINGKEVQVSKEHPVSMYEGYVEVYALPNGEVKVEFMNTFSVIYDGMRFKVRTYTSIFRNAGRGLCGTFNDRVITDFVSAHYCIVKDPKEFASSYTILIPRNRNERQTEHSQSNTCFKDDIIYNNVISDYDLGRFNQSVSYARYDCTKHQTRYVDEPGQTCFSTYPLPKCKSGCKPNGRSKQSEPVHCIKSGNVADLLKKQIDKGASPDFSKKKITKYIIFDTPTKCTK